jgi:hypothetical protein
LINFGVPHQFLNGILCVVPNATEYLRTHQQQKNPNEMKFKKLFYTGTDVQFSPEQRRWRIYSQHRPP